MSDNNDKFVRLGIEIGSLVSEKNKAYGDSFARSGKILEILYPNGIEVRQYTDVLAITRMLDKFFRIATKKGAFGEEAFMDLAGYALLGVAKDRGEREEE